MCNACASRKILHTASRQRLLIAHAVFVAELAFHNVREDLSIPVWVLAKPRGSLDVIVVDDPQSTKVHVFRVVVICKGKVEP